MLENIRKACIDIERVREKMYIAYERAVDEIVKRGEISPPLLQGNKLDIEYKNDVIKIHIPDYLPLIKYKNTDAKNRWFRNIYSSLLTLKKTPNWEKIFVYIVVSAPGEKWDIDNRYLKVIIDAIRCSRLIKDDNICHLAYGAEGLSDTKYYTDIYIFDYHKLSENLPKIVKR